MGKLNWILLGSVVSLLVVVIKQAQLLNKKRNLQAERNEEILKVCRETVTEALGEKKTRAIFEVRPRLHLV
jgi:hypothetical protein